MWSAGLCIYPTSLAPKHKVNARRTHLRQLYTPVLSELVLRKDLNRTDWGPMGTLLSWLTMGSSSEDTSFHTDVYGVLEEMVGQSLLNDPAYIVFNS